MKKIFVIILILIIIGGFLVKVQNNLDLSKKEDKISLVRYTIKWIGKVAKNTYEITAYAIKKDWSPEEEK